MLEQERNMAVGRRDQFDVTSRRQSTSPARADRGVLRIIMCIGVALAQSPLVRAQDAVPTILPEPAILPELSKRTGPEPMKAKAPPIPDEEKPSIEILAGTPGEKPAPLAKQKPPQKLRQYRSRR